MTRPVSGEFAIISPVRFEAARTRKRLFRPAVVTLARLRFEAESTCSNQGTQDVLDVRVDGVVAERWHHLALGMAITATGFIRPRDHGETCFGEPFIVRDITSARLQPRSPSAMREFRW